MEGSRTGKGKAPSTDSVSSGVLFSLVPWVPLEHELYCRAELVPLWGKGADLLLLISVNQWL